MEILIMLIVALILFWGYQFVFLMMMEDGVFPGRLDKAIWGAAFIFVAPLAPFVFVLWRMAILSRVKEGPQSDAQPAPGTRR